MEHVRRWLIVLAAFVLIVSTAMVQFRLGAWYQQSFSLDMARVLSAGGLGPTLLTAHIIKVLLLPLAVDLSRRRYRAGAFLAIVLFFGLAVLSAGSTFGALSIQRHDRVVAESGAAKREEDLRAELSILGHRLKDIGFRRAVAEVGGDIAAHQRDPRWSSSRDCRAPTTRLERSYCARYDRLKGEYAASKETEEARGREHRIRETLLAEAPTSQIRHPDLELLARAFSVPAEQVAFWRTLLIAVALEAAEAIPLWIATLLSSSDHGVRSGRETWRAWLRRLRSRLAKLSIRRIPLDPPAVVDVATDASVRRSDRRRETKPESSDRPRAASEPNPWSNRADTDIGGSSSRAQEAVTAFVELLLRDPTGRETGSALYLAYERTGARYDWPPLPAHTFGALLKPAIEKVGGRKVKSNCQFYIGVRLPPAL